MSGVRRAIIGVAVLALAACGEGRPVAPEDAGGAPDVAVATPDTWRSDGAVVTPDTWRPDAAWCKGSCTKACPAPTGSGISLCGSVFEGRSLLARLAGGWKPEPVCGKLGAQVRVYDPLAFVTAPTSAKPLAVGALSGGGCFYVTNVTIPFSGFFVLVVDDADPAQDIWAPIATGEVPASGKTSAGLELFALTHQAASTWGPDLVKEGSMILMFRDKAKMGVAGITPTLAQQAPPWPGHEVLFLSDDGTKVVAGAKVTTKSGAVIVRKATVKEVSGQKGACSVEAGLGGSAPGTLLFKALAVSGC